MHFNRRTRELAQRPEKCTVIHRGEEDMRYIVAWMLGVPGIVVVIWFLMSHH